MTKRNLVECDYCGGKESASALLDLRTRWIEVSEMGEQFVNHFCSRKCLKR